MTQTDASDRPGGVKGLIARGKQLFATLQRNHPSVRHAVAAYQRLSQTNGNLYAGAITYFSFLAIFPLLLLAVAIAGFVLASHPAALQTLFDNISNKAPGEVGRTLRKSIRSAIDARTGVGIVGLAGFLFTGLGWIGNLRQSIDAVWKLPQAKRNFVKAKLANLLILGGLGLGLIVSLGLTAGWSTAANEVLSLLHLDNIPGMGTLLGLLGILVTLVGDTVIFLWLLARLPQVDVPRRAALKGAVLAAVGFEILKIVGTYTVAKSASSTATAGPFASIIAVLVWIQLVVRFVLYCVAMTAVLTDEENAVHAAGTARVVDPTPAELDVPTLRPAAVGVTLVGAGAVAGAAVTALTARRVRRGRDPAA